MNRSTVVAGLVAVVSSSLLCAQETFTAEGTVKTVDTSDRQNPPPVLPLSANVSLEPGAPDGATVDLDAPWHGTAKVGGRSILVAVGKSDAGLDHPDLLYVDADGDGALTDVEQIVLDTEATERGGRTMVQSKPVEGGLAGNIAFQAVYRQSGDRAMVSMVFPRYLEAKTPAAVIAIVDKDLDGSYGSAGDVWAVNQPGGQPVREYGLLQMGERGFHDGKLFQIGVDGETVEVVATPSEGPDPQTAAAQRERAEHIWFERFDEEREGFVSSRGLDTKRPVTEQPIAWKYVTFEEAIELGKKSNKPVFIDVMAFWCVWCYRMDYYTYVDAEVAKVLTNDFIPVKVIQEQDLAGDYTMLMKDKLQARGIPAMGVFDTEGNVLHTIGGWKKPEDFLKELETAKSKFTGE